MTASSTQNPTAARKLWTAALRSGEYEQGSGWLRQNDDEGNVKWCCLGVLCDVAQRHGIISGFDLAGVNLDGEKVVLDWVGLVNGDGTYLDADQVWQRLTRDNDGEPNPAYRRPHPLTFSEIAAIIDAEPEALFA